MVRYNLRRLSKYALIGGAAAGTAFSLKANNYDINSVGIVRLARAAATVFDIGVYYKLNLYYKHGLNKHSKEYLKLKSRCHKMGAEKLLQLCCTNKGVYIKVGQHLGALDYLLPKEYVQTMKVLHSHAPQNSLSEVYRVLREDLKADPDELFECFEPEPLGVASLAQVHKAILRDGHVVAVKVQHPYVRSNCRVDLTTMEALVKIVSWVFPEFKFQWLVDEMKRNIPQELDFENEGHNAEKIAAMFRHYEWLKVPAVHWNLTAPRVLTMDFVEGGQVNDLQYMRQHGIDPFEVSDKLGKLYSQMIFINGFVHSDPHPGNILVKKTEEGSCDIILLDHGLYAKLSPEFRAEYAKLWLSILKTDRKAMRLHSQKLGIEGDMYGLFACMVTGRTWDTIMMGVDKKRPTKKEKELFQREFPTILPQISTILQTVNSQMLLILRTNDLMRGIEHTLKTQARMNSFWVMSQYCIRSVYNQRLEEAKSKVAKLKVIFSEYWVLFKLNVYYVLLGISRHLKFIK